MKALLAAGGTGGHMFPAQSLSEELTRLGWDCAMITDGRGRKHAGRIKADPVIEVQAASISPRRPIKALRGTMQLARGVRQAKSFMRDWQPDVVIGFGGYPSFPALRAAESLNIPRVIHEQNAVLGRVNRVFARKATIVASGFDRLEKLPVRANHVVVGNPLRDAIIRSVSRSVPKTSSHINILAVGGSLGANILSDVVPEAIAALPEPIRMRLRLTQQVTESRLDAARAVYERIGAHANLATFFTDIEDHLAKADLIIARAGASSVSEIALMGKPSILIPLAIAMDDHQTANARALESLGAAKIVPESEFTVARLSKLLSEILNDQDWLDQAGRNAKKLARPDAARDLAALVVSAAG
ncbi:undecaprenyldiphospho-muramoylpentapeptide beta-N-acetylglucosaminyltransferase [Algimonas porphyrae]|uniref:UDP-N-acetylglucosamine--N-acetylmuramyl-(pentapeptide) pyrophosphoryl-undecaprenol N-acetylglucosamine transferase n=1 Tax=Algimonas porphyrae TaxID=1128113 RepID=A0ABQ5UY38_9PROT|nr:undecaprenyldiphospho-muramoylpentapeptide beta-N-acetylglucosaminyltransferase [Algimonas porphyrae]GLQ20068.1 UDP-N-acetylglucosamine--N-acetylmuramyl-(pentapeptide) pyrophosphoryl-undecaprenol N-acetylglucosamine transferase [Algimonas porphyrae]